jgi:branched-chain amino acid aminotransferase
VEERVFLNGSLVAGEEARISVDDRGLLFGDGLFETMRSYGGKVFRMDRHLGRLFDSMETIRIRLPYDTKELEEAIYATIRANHLPDAYIRLTITRGAGGRGLDPPESSCPTVVIVARELIPYSAHLYHAGMKVDIARNARSLPSPLSRLKSLNFLNNVLARIEARERGTDEAILLNSNGFVSEGTVSNVFLVREGVLITPDVESGILPGITRETILDLAREKRISLEERLVNTTELFEAEEIFLTNTLMEIMPVSEIDGARVGKDIPGALTYTFMNEYSRRVRK